MPVSILTDLVVPVVCVEVQRASEHVVPQLINLLTLFQQLLAGEVSFPTTWQTLSPIFSVENGA